MASLSALLWLPAPLICGLLIRLTACFLGRLTVACLSALLWLPSPLICGLLIRLTMVTMGGDLQPGCLADRLLTGLGQPQMNP